MRLSRSGVDTPEAPFGTGTPGLRVDCGVLALFANSDGLGLMLGVVVQELVRSATSSCSISSRAVGPPTDLPASGKRKTNGNFVEFCVQNSV